MAFVPLYGLETNITAPTLANAGQIQVDSNVANQIAARLGSNFTYASLSDGVNYELIRINAVNSPNLIVTRGVSGTLSSNFPTGACIRYVWVTESIQAVSTALNFSFTGQGAAQVTQTGTNSWVINVTTPVIGGSGPIEVLGGYPNWEITTQALTTGCCTGGGSGGGSGGISNVTGTGLASVVVNSGVATVNVPPPNFVGAGGLTITGAWPNYTFAQSGSSGSGVLSITGSAKILLSGPATTPTISLNTTGVGAGTYNGVTYDSYGTILSVDASYQPVTLIQSSQSFFHTLNFGVGEYALSIDLASTTGFGVVQLAPPTSAGSNNPSDATNVVTPAGVNAVLAALPNTNSTLQVSSNYTAAPLANYTNTVPSTSLTLGLTGTKSALITASLILEDTATPGVAPTWGFGVFQGSTLLQGTTPATAGSQIIQFLVNAPLAGILTIKTTTLTGTTNIVGQSLTAVIVP